MYINIYRDKMRFAHLFGASVLYTPHFIPREDVPSGWYCYELCGTVRNPDEFYALTDTVKEKDRIASVLSFLPLKDSGRKSRRIRGIFELTQEQLTLAEFCENMLIRYPGPQNRQELRDMALQEQDRPPSEPDP